MVDVAETREKKLVENMSPHDPCHQDWVHADALASRRILFKYFFGRLMYMCRLLLPLIFDSLSNQLTKHLHIDTYSIQALALVFRA